MSRRRPTADEVELWRKVADQAEPLHPRRRETFDPEAIVPTPKPAPRRKAEPTASRFPARPAPKKTAKDLAPSLAEGLRAAPLQMDRKTFTRLRRGKLKPEARIDLHGMTLDRAHVALTRFILSSQSAGRRLVLVITGKGKDRDDDGPIPVRHGVLKHQVPQWLRLQPLAAAVLQVEPAHIRHGGSGAYYVYLRR
ncbi:Smr/MutS family protein [Sulfitobacter sp. D35]|uniref:Smr/MutS family protein n=1 Tax=Sulfitobacter sp. D35 TaxID=3083252 RepID=UPI00296F6DE1|nr:Smr/MutS family protein [Sulfitobacter sp. D35]MDW4498084.1 Smr/MutS family protein [Sulfitobacter sp. D35]